MLLFAAAQMSSKPEANMAAWVVIVLILILLLWGLLRLLGLRG